MPTSFTKPTLLVLLLGAAPLMMGAVYNPKGAVQNKE